MHALGELGEVVLVRLILSNCEYSAVINNYKSIESRKEMWRYSLYIKILMTDDDENFYNALKGVFSGSTMCSVGVLWNGLMERNVGSYSLIKIFQPLMNDII